MVLAALVGAPLGASVGILAGSLIFSKVRREEQPFLKKCDISADKDEDIPMPDTAGKPVSIFKKLLLKDTSPSLTQPDYERALFINEILTLLWPHLSPAIHKEVMKQAKAPIADALAKIPLVEDIRIDRLDLGERPFRIDSFKTYTTSGDEIIIEAPAFWGGDVHVRATAVVRAGPVTVDLPVDVANIQFKALTRITVALVETLPCAGGVTLSLLEVPTVDFDLNVVDSPDIMALPGVPLAVRSAVSIVAGKMLVYPNEFTVPLMPNFGRPPPPQGMLRVTVKAAHDLKSQLLDTVDPYITVEVRQGRPARTAVVANNRNPVFEEDLDLVVDDPAKQHLTVVVMDDDMVSADVVGGAVVELAGAAFLAAPRRPVTLRLPVYGPGEGGVFPTANSADLALASQAAASDAAVAAAVAALPKRRGLRGVFGRKRAAKAAKAATDDSLAAASVAGSSGGTTPVGEPSTPRSPGAASAAGAAAEEGVSRKRPPPGAVTGSVTLELTYFPFERTVKVAEADEEAADAAAPAAAATAAAVATAEAAGEGDAPAAPSLTSAISMRRSLAASSLAAPNPLARGVLTVNLRKVMHLAAACDSYVVVRLYDPHRLPVPDMATQTKIEFNEASPRFNFVTDFVNISAASVLSLTVYSQPGTMAALTSLRVPLLQKAKPKALGRVRVPLDEVVREGRVNSAFPLLEAQTGEMFLTLEWSGVDLGQPGEDAAAAAVAAADAADALQAAAADA